MPGFGNGPPIIPPNTGGARGPPPAAFQSEVQRKWLYPDDYQTDRESGIGIAVTSTESSVTGEAGTGREIERAAAQDDLLGISKVDFVSRLPPELAIGILAHLDAAGLARGRPGLQELEHRDEQPTHLEGGLPAREDVDIRYQRPRQARPPASASPAIRPENDWRQIYRVKQELDRRWREGKARPVYLNGPQGQHLLPCSLTSMPPLPLSPFRDLTPCLPLTLHSPLSSFLRLAPATTAR